MPQYKIALDIGATKTLAGLIVKNKVIKKIKKPTGSNKSNAQIIKNIKSQISELMVKNVKQIGIGIAGQVDHKNGIVISTTNFNPSFKKIDLVKVLQKEFKIPVLLDNDVKALAKSEIKTGYGKIFNNFISLTFGTGIGGAIVINGNLLRGMNNLAGEIGHMKISGSWIGTAPSCNLKHKYCWESLASGRAWYKLSNKHGAKKADSIIIPNIATGLNNLAVAFNPHAFVIGGGLTEHPNIINKIKKEFDNNSFHPLIKKTRIVKTKLGEDSILFGALID